MEVLTENKNDNPNGENVFEQLGKVEHDIQLYTHYLKALKEKKKELLDKLFTDKSE